MNDETTELQPWIEPELEARIVAWVVGEASPFEISELERLVTERPEVALFKQRIEAVHGVLGKALKEERNLRLGEERRARVLGAIGQVAEPVGPRVGVLNLRKRPWWKREGVLAAMAACLLVGLLFFGFLLPARTRVQATSLLSEGRALPLEAFEASGSASSSFGVVVPEANANFSEALEDSESDGSSPSAISQPSESKPDSMPQELDQLLASSPTKLPSLGLAAPTMPAAPAPVTMVAPSASRQPVGGALISEGGSAGERKRDSMIPKSEFYSDTDTPQSAPAERQSLAKRKEVADRAVERPGQSIAKGKDQAPMAGDPPIMGRLGGQFAEQRSEGAPRKGEIDDSAARNNLGAEVHADNRPVQRKLTSMGLREVETQLKEQEQRVALAQAEVNKLFTEMVQFGIVEPGSDGQLGLQDPGQALLMTKEQEIKEAKADLAIAKNHLEHVDKLSAGEPVRSFSNLQVGFELPEKSASAMPTLLTKEYPLPPSLSQQPNVQAALESMGVSFPPEASAQVVRDRLIVRNTQSNIDLVDVLLEAEQAKIERTQQKSEILASVEPFSTFSLHVSDVSFKLAVEAMKKGAMPDPEKIRPEEFYNAFDYGDPAPGIDEAVTCRIEQARHPVLQNRNLVRLSVKVGSTGRNASQPLQLTLLLDTSGSMEREDRAASVQKALDSLASLLGPNDRVALIGFARRPRLLAEQLPGDQATKLGKLAAETPSEGGTNLEEALRLASELARKHKRSNAQNRIVLLTDGAANLGNADPEQLAAHVEALRAQGIAFDACGVGAAGLNDEILEALTRKGDGRYYFLNQPGDADAGFAKQLAGAFRPAAENVKLQVRWNAGRVGHYRLIGFEKHRLKTEDFRNDKVDAAELAAEEAAVALYQVEPNPSGEGELGEVFVRFRNPGTGQMLERSWTISYEPNAPAFDQASATLRLAGIAAITAENLNGINVTDPKELSTVAAELRSEFPTQPRVSELLKLFEKSGR